MKTTYINTEDLYLIQSAAGHREFMADVSDAVSLTHDWRWSRINHGLITISRRGHVISTSTSAIAEETIRRRTSR